MRWVLAALLCSGTAGVLSDEVELTPSTEEAVLDKSRYLEAAAAAQRGDYVVAYCFWRPLAEQGDAEAQYALGWMYHNGYGLVTDDLAAKAWWEKAVAQGHTDAMFSLGTLYSVGSSAIVRDYPNAMRLWTRAAAAGHVNARYALRELAQRKLPELTGMTLSLRKKHPHLLPVRGKGKGANSKMVIAERTTLERYLHSGELVAIAAGYRPVLGWVAAYLVREGDVLITSLSTRRSS